MWIAENILMKNTIKFLMQKLLGFRNYLYLFSLYTIRKALSKQYEPGFFHFIELIPYKGIILDIGANVGITCIPLAKAKKTSVVHAYEPILENFQTLEKAVIFYKSRNVTLFNFALGDQEGKLNMIMPIRGKARQQGLSKVYIENSNETGIKYEVTVKRLDDLYPDDNISAIKIDVENFEYEVLLGAVNLIKRCKPIIYCELWNNEKRFKVFNMLKKLNYTAHLFDNTTKSLIPLNDTTISIDCNFILLPG